MTLETAFEKFIFSRHLNGLSEKSIKCYTTFILPFVDDIGIELNIHSLTRDMVDHYISSLFNRKISRATLATYVRHIKVFLRWVEDNLNIDIMAKTIRIPRTPKKMLRIYNDDEIIAIFNSIYAENKWLTSRNRAIIALMLDSGLRQNEVCTLKKKDVLFHDSMVKVLGKGNKERIVPIGALTSYYLQVYLKQCQFESKNVFVNRRGEALTCDAVKHMMYKLSETLPFEFSSHKLRHNFATNYCLDQYERNGQIDIYKLMVLLGHEDIDTTRRYLHLANQIIASRANISHIDRILQAIN